MKKLTSCFISENLMDNEMLFQLFLKGKTSSVDIYQLRIFKI